VKRGIITVEVVEGIEITAEVAEIVITIEEAEEIEDNK
jgi:hypothetical protein